MKILMSFRCRDDNEPIEHVNFGVEIYRRHTAYLHVGMACWLQATCSLPALRYGVLVASYMQPTYTSGMACWLQATCNLPAIRYGVLVASQKLQT